MTTFGGQTVPPLFVGAGGGGGGGNIAIGASFQSPVTVGNRALDIPPRDPGDRLCAICITGGTGDFNPIEAANWGFQREINEGAGGGSKIWIRTATGDANDTFTIPNAFTNLRWFVMVAVKSPNGWFGSNVGNSNNTGAPTSVIPFSALNAAAPARTQQLSLLMARVPDQTDPGDDDITGPPGGWNTVEFGSILDNGGNTTGGYGVFWRFDEPPVNIAGGNIGLDSEFSAGTVSSRIVAPHGPFA